MPSPPRTPTGHHITVHNRRWRASDPAIPPKLRQELVNVLMAGRRGVRCDGARGSVARRKVQDAKVALGERGVEWWAEDVSDSHQQTTDAGGKTKQGKGGGKVGEEEETLWWQLPSKQTGLHARIDSTIRTLCRAREHGTVCPSEVSRAVAGDATEDWRDLMPLVRERAEGLVRRGQIEICQKGVRVEPGEYRGPIRLRVAEGIDNLDEGHGGEREEDHDGEEADGKEEGDGKEDDAQGEQEAESKAEAGTDEEDKDEKDRDEEGKEPAKAKERENGKKRNKRRHTPPAEAESDSLPLRSGKRRR